MTRARRLASVLPPLVVGASVAGAAEMSAGLLLYSAEGFLPALTLILTVETGAFALGMWSGALAEEHGTVESLRRRWLFALVAFALAAAFSTGLSFLEDAFTGGIGQGLGLAFLGSLPLFSLGSLLSGMADPVGSRALRVGLPAVAGVALGFLLTGGVLIPNLAPYTLYLLCLTALSGGALLHGWALDSQEIARLVAEEWSHRGMVRVEDRKGEGEAEGVRVILEGGRLRGAERESGSLALGWERGILAALKGEGGEGGAALYVGGGDGVLARHLLDTFPGLTVMVVEGTETFLKLAREHLYPFDKWGEVQLQTGEPWEVMERAQGPFGLLLVDLAFLPSLGAVPDLDDRRWGTLARLSGPEGTVVLGGLPPMERVGALPLEALLARGALHFPRVAHYEGEEEGFLLLSGSEAPYWSPILPGFHVTNAEEV